MRAVERTWTVVLACRACGQTFIHVELSPEDDEPDGLPPGFRCGRCGALDSLSRVGTN